MQLYIEFLIRTPEKISIVSKTNEIYICKSSLNQKLDVRSTHIKKVSQKCGAKKPELLTSTRFGKQIATILQLMNFQNVKMEQVALFMGYTGKIYREFYRCADGLVESFSKIS